MTGTFTIARTPHLYFGKGKFSELTSILGSFGKNVLLVTGARSFLTSESGRNLTDHLRKRGFAFEHFIIPREPTPDLIDNAVKRFRSFHCDVVVAIGGGSVLDAGKAISAMLPLNESVKDYLESVGTKAMHPGIKTPFVAVPTTSGTGSEATKNAVISETGENGYKKSLRHNNFVPDVALVDPLLTVNCPPSITASSGMDAFTQLFESYVSTAANPITDGLAVEGLARTAQSLRKVYADGSDTEARTDMSLASYLSGITLANAGLGLVHGFASSIGGFFDIPHGVICSSLMYACNKFTVEKLRQHHSNDKTLVKYATIGRMFSGASNKSDDYYTDSLLEVIKEWTIAMNIPGLGSCGVLPEHFGKIVAIADNKNNPVALEKDEMIQVLEAAS